MAIVVPASRKTIRQTSFADERIGSQAICRTHMRPLSGSTTKQAIRRGTAAAPTPFDQITTVEPSIASIRPPSTSDHCWSRRRSVAAALAGSAQPTDAFDQPTGTSTPEASPRRGTVRSRDG